MKLAAAYRWSLVGLMALVVASQFFGCASERSERPSPYSTGQGDIRETARNWGNITPRAKLDAGGSLPTAPEIAGSRPNRDEELWVIEKNPQNTVQPQPQDDVPGCGALMAQDPQTKKNVPIPLKHTEVKADIAGYIATVEVTQQYHNPFDTKIEALYVFPLPHNAAVNEFVMTIGDRHIRGLIREREEAKRIYEQAKAQGYVASLLTQERPNIFTQAVANIEPGKQIDIDIKYFHTLSYVDGSYEFVFPMVVGPRFNPPDMTTGVGAVARDAAGASGQKTEIQYLHPSERSGHDIALSLHLNAGVKVESVTSATHQIDTNQPNEQTAEVKLQANDAIPNRDFILRYKVAGQVTKSALIAQRNRDTNDGYFTLMLYPPSQLQNLPRKPLELVFVVDVSGSQTGAPLDQEKAGVRYALTHMGPQDTFQIIRFGNTAQKFNPTPLPATPENARRGIDWTNALTAGEGTMLAEGVRAALDFPHDESRLRFVSFMTDGFIGNEAEVIGEIHRLLGPSRIFSFGVGNSTNRYLLEHMAKIGNGAAAFLGTRDNADEIMQQFFERISHPALTDISIDWGGMQVEDVYPQRIPDLFVGRPVTITGRFHGQGKPQIKIKGKVGIESNETNVTADLDDASAIHQGISAIWARNKIADMYDRTAWEPNNQLPQQIKQLALEHGLMSAYTAFVAVDATQKTQGQFGVTVPVPVPVPDGVRYDTTVQTTGATSDH